MNRYYLKVLQIQNSLQGGMEHDFLHLGDLQNFQEEMQDQEERPDGRS